MKLKVEIDDRVAAQAGKRAQSLGKTIDELVREYLHALANDDPERCIAELQRLSGGGDSHGWSFNREQIHRRSK